MMNQAELLVSCKDFADGILIEIRKARLLVFKQAEGLDKLVDADYAWGALIAAREGAEWSVLNGITGDVLDAMRRRCEAFLQELEGNEGH